MRGRSTVVPHDHPCKLETALDDDQGGASRCVAEPILKRVFGLPLLSVRRRYSQLVANYILIRYFGLIGGMIREKRRSTGLLARRHALNLLTLRTEGCTMSMLLEHGVKIEIIYSLIAAGLATAHADRVGQGDVQALRIKITDAGLRRVTIARARLEREERPTDAGRRAQPDITT
jgi:hypothetical protein